MKKRKFLNIFCVSLFCFFIGSFKVGAITCEYPFSYTVDGKKVSATLVFTESYVSSVSPADYSTQHYVQRELEVKDVKGMEGSGLEYKISDSKKNLEFGGYLTSMYYTKEGAEDYINNIYNARQCDVLYYKVSKKFFSSTMKITFSLKKEGDFQNPLVSTTVIDNSKPSNPDDGKNDNPDNPDDSNGDNILDKEGCDSLGNEVVDILRSIFRLIQIAGPLLAIGFGMTDFVGAVLSSEDGAIKKAAKKFITRLIAAALLFLIPVLLEFLLQFIGYSGTVCID